MYDRENFKIYIGSDDSDNYFDSLNKFEEGLKVNIDEEYNKDKCQRLLFIAHGKSQDTKITFNERKLWADAYSHLKKYIEFKDLINNNNKELFKQWIAKQPQIKNPSKLYSPKSCYDFTKALEKGLTKYAKLDEYSANFFFVNDVKEVNTRKEKYKADILFYDEKNDNSDLKNGIEFYLKFLIEKNRKIKLQEIINAYKEEFARIDKEERYKWEAIKQYKDNWDIDAPDFGTMVERAFSKTYNLLAAGQYYARKMLVGISKEHPEEVRNLFRMLFNESLPLEKRFDDFRSGFDVFVKEQGKSHYQDLHAISVYLTFEYPEKYYIYKYGVWTGFLKNIDEPIPSTKGKHETFKIENSNKICDEILSLVCEDIELCSMSASRLDNNCYDDPEYRMLAFDIMFYGSNYKSDESDGWWPSLEEYDPNLSKDDWKKFVLEVEKPNHPSPMQMLKAMIESGGIASCKQLSQNFGGTASYYVGCTTNLGRRVKKYFDLPVCMDGDQERYFPFPFQGKALDNEEGHQYLYRVRPELREALAEIDLSDISPYCDVKEDESMTDVDKNIILYGPPGTGKTYVTARYAVAIIENKPLSEIEKLDYEEVLERYNRYKNDNRIEFTTFHQSYGYEEFIEGIKPVAESDEDSEIRYEVTPGLFKSFCDEAKPIIKNNSSDLGLNNSPTVWKVSLCSTGDNAIRTDCMINGHIRIGWDDYGPDITGETDFSKCGGKKVLNSFIYKMQPGDIVVSCYSNTTIDAVGVVTGDYEWNDN